MASRLKASKLTSFTGQTKANDKPEKSLQQQIYETQIHGIELQRLKKTFNRICNPMPQKSSTDKQDYKRQQTQISTYLSSKDKFDKKDIIRILTELNFQYTKPQVDQWIWQVDEDLDGCINQYQFTLMYKRCIFDKTGLQPRNLFNLVQFLMYDLACRNRITVQDTLQLIYVRHPDQELLQYHITEIFGDREKTEDGQEREIFFEEYLAQMRKIDLSRRKKLEQQRKTVTIPKKKQSDD